MVKDIGSSIVLYFICLILVGFYTITIYFVGHGFWPERTSGSLIINKENQIRGSFLIAQQLNSPKYFRARPYIEYDSECDCDVALYNPNLKAELISKYKAEIHPYDVSMITSSASGYDPFITRREAINQAPLIAKARNFHSEKVYKLIDENTLYKSWPFFELDIVNTSVLNNKLDEL